MYDNYGQNQAHAILNRLGRLATLAASKAAKFIGKKLILIFLKALIATAPFWVPVVLFLILVWLIYQFTIGIPMNAMEDPHATTKDRVEAFYAFSEEEEFIDNKMDLFDRYKEIASQWDDGLTEDQRNQVESHAFSWGFLAAVDRLVHDPAYQSERTHIQIDPEKVFNALRPEFKWKESTITIVEKYEVTVCKQTADGLSCHTETRTRTTTEEVELVTEARTVEGTFSYHYKTKTYKEGNKTITKEVLDKVDAPDQPFQPFYTYLETQGITHEDDIELAIELIKIYDPIYVLNFEMARQMDFAHFQPVEGANEWVWVTLSERVTSPFGPRSGEIHKGVDVGSLYYRNGDPIFAMEDGVVDSVVSQCVEGVESCGGRYGNLIVIDHGEGVQTRYAHLHKVFVNNGEEVKKGQVIATMGNTGKSTGTHLHFEIRVDGVPQNPAFYFPSLN